MRKERLVPLSHRALVVLAHATALLLSLTAPVGGGVAGWISHGIPGHWLLVSLSAVLAVAGVLIGLRHLRRAVPAWIIAAPLVVPPLVGIGVAWVDLTTLEGTIETAPPDVRFQFWTAALGSLNLPRDHGFAIAGYFALAAVCTGCLGIAHRRESWRAALPVAAVGVLAGGVAVGTLTVISPVELFEVLRYGWVAILRLPLAAAFLLGAALMAIAAPGVVAAAADAAEGARQEAWRAVVICALGTALAVVGLGLHRAIGLEGEIISAIAVAPPDKKSMYLTIGMALEHHRQILVALPVYGLAALAVGGVLAGAARRAVASLPWREVGIVAGMIAGLLAVNATFANHLASETRRLTTRFYVGVPRGVTPPKSDVGDPVEEGFGLLWAKGRLSGPTIDVDPFNQAGAGELEAKALEAVGTLDERLRVLAYQRSAVTEVRLARLLCPSPGIGAFELAAGAETPALELSRLLVRLRGIGVCRLGVLTVPRHPLPPRQRPPQTPESFLILAPFIESKVLAVGFLAAPVAALAADGTAYVAVDPDLTDRSALADELCAGNATPKVIVITPQAETTLQQMIDAVDAARAADCTEVGLVVVWALPVS